MTVRHFATPMVRAFTLVSILLPGFLYPGSMYAAEPAAQGIQEATDMIERIRQKDQLSTEEIIYLTKIMDTHELETVLDAADHIESCFISSESYVDNFRNQYRSATTVNIDGHNW